jgi:hypothetical protein
MEHKLHSGMFISFIQFGHIGIDQFGEAIDPIQRLAIDELICTEYEVKGIIAVINYHEHFLIRRWVFFFSSLPGSGKNCRK